MQKLVSREMIAHKGLIGALFALLLASSWAGTALGAAKLGVAAADSTGSARAEPAVPAGRDSLVLFHTNDTHSQLDPLSRGRGEPRGGVAARAALLTRERAGVPASLTLDAGDVF